MHRSGFRQSCFLVGFPWDFHFGMTCHHYEIREKRALSPSSHRHLDVAFAENYELVISGRGFNSTKKKDEVICRFKFSENKFFGK